MKKILIFATVLLSFSTSYGQGKTPTFSNPNYVPSPYCIGGQMLNTKNTYGYIGQTAGNFKDSVSADDTLYLTIANAGTPINAVDTFVPYPIYAYGLLSVGLSVQKISGTLSGVAYLQNSPDGVNWYNVNTNTSDSKLDSFNVENLSYTNTWVINDFPMPFNRLVFITDTGTMAAMVQARYFTKSPTYIQSK